MKNGNSGTAIFHNDAQTMVGKQIGQADLFSNQPGGKEKRTLCPLFLDLK